ncbi:MAG: hypothetical protein JWM90_2521, partial [Thermoleophilia bacterium]|nr:hypothetical protein [Thermoleophilia bacterium]
IGGGPNDRADAAPAAQELAAHERDIRSS